MIFIGHLDMMRFFQKAFRRSGLPIAYSTGFSPHQIMSFAQPLGVGVYSDGEYFDVEFEEKVEPDLIKERLSAVMATGVDIINVRELPDDAGNAMASIAAAGYTIRLRDGHFPELSLTEHFEAFMAQPEILYEKETKRSVKELNIKDFIFEYKVMDEEIYLFLDASSAGNLNPAFVMDAYFKWMGKESQKLDFVIKRMEIYYRTDEGKLLPLEEAGVR
ncbi:MAG: TIGR03936 family radical SAM-associated protein [Lachnospiraceae bacterium]|nr:TIGR03936 family radical SAM-associated protein [Lachnospiraceae bacterium]